MLFVIYACIILILSANKSNSWNTYASEKTSQHERYTYDNRGSRSDFVLRPEVPPRFLGPIFLREFYLQGPCLKKKMPSLKWSHGVKRHHFVFSLVPFFCCCKHEFQFPWYNCQFFYSRFGYYKSHKDFSCAQSPVADSPLTRSWWIKVEKSPRKIFETKNSTWKIWIEQISDLQFQDRFFLRRDYTKIVVVKVICFSKCKWVNDKDLTGTHTKYWKIGVLWKDSQFFVVLKNSFNLWRILWNFKPLSFEHGACFNSGALCFSWPSCHCSGVWCGAPFCDLTDFAISIIDL